MGRRQGKREGRLEGVEEGQRAEALRIAQTMLAEGMALETVLSITGLSEAHIRAVIHELIDIKYLFLRDLCR